MNKLFLSIIIGIVVMILVFIGVNDSLTRPSLNRIPITNNTAVEIVKNLEYSLNNSTLSKIQSKYVLVKGDGSVYSLKDDNTIDKKIGITQPTISTGNHFAWQIITTPSNMTYYVDHITGQVISSK